MPSHRSNSSRRPGFRRLACRNICQDRRSIRRYMLPSMDDNELNELVRRREAWLRVGIPREEYGEAVERSHELRGTAFAAAFQAFLRALSGGTHTDPSGDDSMI